MEMASSRQVNISNLPRLRLIATKKELYEPLWDDLAVELQKKGKKIRAIWMADLNNQGASNLLNEESKYEDGERFAAIKILIVVSENSDDLAVFWYDHTRDLAKIIDHFHTEMVQPIIAIGHSMGAYQTYENLPSSHE